MAIGDWLKVWDYEKCRWNLEKLVIIIELFLPILGFYVSNFIFDRLNERGRDFLLSDFCFNKGFEDFDIL